jgi:histidine triad (HIT) family protein
MSSCGICGIAEGKIKAKVVYEDNVCMAYLKHMPCSPGHIMLVPKKHYTIFEQLPDDEIIHLFDVASKLSTVAFETLGRGGTNIIVQNGSSAGQTHPHFSIEIIPRNENDGLNFMWQPRHLSEEEMSTAELILKELMADFAVGAGKKKEGPVQEKKHEMLKEEKGKENYLFKSLIRIP